MNKILISIAAIGLGSLAFTPATFAQSSSEQPAMSTEAPNEVDQMEFDAADLDKSGELSFEEAVSLIPTLTQAQFDQLDGNDNGTLSIAEIGTTPQDGSLLSDSSGDNASSEESSAPAN